MLASWIWKTSSDVWLTNRSLRELIQQDDGPWEEALLVDSVRCPDLAEARVVLVDGVRCGSTGISTTIWYIMLSLAWSVRFREYPSLVFLSSP